MSADRADWIPWARPQIFGNEAKYVSEALASTWISGGPYVDRFEREFAARHGMAHAVSASNGTTALHMTFLALGIGPGDEVIVPSFAFHAAANIALHVGARPVFADVDRRTWCLDPEALEPSRSRHSRVVVPVHTYGNVCDMGRILAWARQRDVLVVEDVAEALASRRSGRLAGTLGDVSTFSFQATKTLTTGEGGMALTASEEHAQRMREFRNHGMLRKRYWHDVPGHNFRLPNLQAAMGCAQLELLDGIVQERERIIRRYRERLDGAEGIALQRFTPDTEAVIWACAVELAPERFPQGRDRVIEQMAEAGIETRPGFYAAHQMDIYAARHCPVAERVSRQVIVLPTFLGLADDAIDRIVESLMGLVR